MKCSYCGGLVTWRGPLTDLTHTQCENYGRQNCQEVETPPEDDEPESEWEHPCPFRGEPTKTPAGEACSACGLREERIDASGATGASNEQKKGLAARPTSRGNLLEIEPNDRRPEESHRGTGEEERRGEKSKRGDAVRAGSTELGARGGDAGQHEVEGGGTGNGAAHGVTAAPAPITDERIRELFIEHGWSDPLPAKEGLLYELCRAAAREGARGVAAAPARQLVGWQFRYVFEDQGSRRADWSTVMQGEPTFTSGYRSYNGWQRRHYFEVRRVYADAVEPYVEDPHHKPAPDGVEVPRG